MFFFFHFLLCFFCWFFFSDCLIAEIFGGRGIKVLSSSRRLHRLPHTWKLSGGHTGWLPCEITDNCSPPTPPPPPHVLPVLRSKNLVGRISIIQTHKLFFKVVRKYVFFFCAFLYYDSPGWQSERERCYGGGAVIDYLSQIPYSRGIMTPPGRIKLMKPLIL